VSQGSPARADGIAAKSPDRRKGVFVANGLGGRWSECIGRAGTCRASDRADNLLGAVAKQRHEANRSGAQIFGGFRDKCGGVTKYRKAKAELGMGEKS